MPAPANNSDERQSSSNGSENARATASHRLSLICINDVYSFDDADTHGPPRGGWSRASTLIKNLKKNYESSDTSSDGTVLITANGDVLGGSSLHQHSKGEVAIEIMNSIGIDLACLGNHEFDFGDEVLMERINESNCRWLGSNVYYPTDTGYFPGVEGDGVLYTLSKSLKLGVFGLCTKQTPKISYPSQKVRFDEDAISVARKTCNSLRARGAHVIVAVTHMSEAEDLLLASDKEAGVDLIVGGHEHEPLSVMVHRGEDCEGQNDTAGVDQKHNQGGVLVFKCGMNAYWVGSVDLDIEYDRVMDNEQQETRITSISTSWAMHSVSSRTPEDSQISQIAKKFRKKTEESTLVASFGQDIASTLHFDDIIATIQTSEGNDSTILPLDTRMSSVRRRESTGSNLVADAMHWMLTNNIHPNQKDLCSLPTLAMINGGFIRADRLYQPGSDFTVSHLLKELPFPRGMVVLKLQGKHLKQALVQQFKGSSRGPTGSFPHLSHNAQLIYTITASESDNEVITIHSLKVDGSEVEETLEYLIAVTGFVADGSEGCTSWLKSCRVENDAWKDKMMSCVLFQYLQQHSVIVPRHEGRVVKLVQ